MEIKTSSGFECVVDEDVLDDWEILESFSAVDRGDVNALFVAAPKFLGDYYEKLKEHIRDEKGRVKASAMSREIAEIMQQTKLIKNS